MSRHLSVFLIVMLECCVNNDINAWSQTMLQKHLQKNVSFWQISLKSRKILFDLSCWTNQVFWTFFHVFMLSYITRLSMLNWDVAFVYSVSLIEHLSLSFLCWVCLCELLIDDSDQIRLKRIINAYVHFYNYAVFLMKLVKITSDFFCLFFSAMYILFQAKSLANRESSCFNHWRCLSLLNRTTRFILKSWESFNWVLLKRSLTLSLQMYCTLRMHINWKYCMTRIVMRLQRWERFLFLLRWLTL